MKSFLAGLGLGIGLGILFAPESGEDTRSNLAERDADLADQARDTIEEGRERIRSGISAVRGMAEAEARPTGSEGGASRWTWHHLPGQPDTVAPVNST